MRNKILMFTYQEYTYAVSEWAISGTAHKTTIYATMINNIEVIRRSWCIPVNSVLEKISEYDPKFGTSNEIIDLRELLKDAVIL